MQSAIFRGAKIRFFDGRWREGGCFINIKWEADYTEPLMETFSDFEWTPLPDAETFAKLKGELVGVKTVEMIPNGTSVKMIDITAIICQKFSLHRVKTDQGGSTVVVRFDMVTLDKGAAQSCQDFKNTYGEGDGQLTVDFEAAKPTSGADPKPADPRQGTLVEFTPEKKKPGRPRKDKADPAPADGSIQ